MKKLLILLLSISLFAACNNDKGSKKADYRDKDDYSNTDEKNTDDDQTDDKSKKDDNQGDFTNGDGEWSEKEKTAALGECMNGFGDRQDLGKQICPCVLEKIQKKYPSLADANKATEEEGRQMGMDCARQLNINLNGENNRKDETDDDGGDYASGGWSSREVKEFVTGCVREAVKGGMEDLDAQSYCDCMQYKIAKIYPNYADANRITAADLQKPAMKKMIRSCLVEN